MLYLVAHEVVELVKVNPFDNGHIHQNALD